jgi:16S rRNA (cytidine1402-2'-O)-methyltransferase
MRRLRDEGERAGRRPALRDELCEERRNSSEGRHASPGRLVVCPTPIGNLEDVTLRVLRELGEADLVLCEDTRRTHVLLDRHGVRARLTSFHRHNEAARTAEVLPLLEAGERIAVVSDAGLPGVNDPGARLLAAAIERGVAVTVLPGPSAVETALVASGLVAEGFSFIGYLPRGRDALDRLWDDLPRGGPTIAFESPRRLPASLASLAAYDPERPTAVCRELTKRFEEVVRGPAAEVAKRFTEPPKGEITLVIGPPPDAHAEETAALDAVAELVDSGVPRRKAAEIVSNLTGVAKNRLYRGSLEPAQRAGESRRSSRDSQRGTG